MISRKSIYILFFLLFQSSLFSLSRSYERSPYSVCFDIGKVCFSLLKNGYIENFRFSNITKKDLDFMVNWKEKESSDSNFFPIHEKYLLDLLKGASYISIKKLSVEDIKDLLKEFTVLFDELMSSRTNYVSTAIIEIAVRFCSITKILLKKYLTDFDIILSYKSILQHILDNLPDKFMQESDEVPKIMRDFLELYVYFNCFKLELSNLENIFSDCEKIEAVVSKISCNIRNKNFKENVLRCLKFTANLGFLIVNKYKPAEELVKAVITKWSSDLPREKPCFYREKRTSMYCMYDHYDMPDEIDTYYIEYAKIFSDILSRLSL